jgi:hypothetical protein
VGGQLHIMICSKRTILEGEELTYDYKVTNPLFSGYFHYVSSHLFL